MAQKHILLIISGGIAAYKACELVRLLRRGGHRVTCVITKGGQQFVSPMTLAALSGNQVYTDLFDLKDEAEMGHIQLSRAADLVVVAPASADLLAKMAAGLAEDLATTLLLATDKKVLAAPAMNVRMWQHPSTAKNIEFLQASGVGIIGPDDGDMACGEFGPGRLVEPAAIYAAICAELDVAAEIDLPAGAGALPLLGRHVLITAGPTHEPIDPVRYIANRSSGKQGFALAEAAAQLGAEVTLIAGPVHLPTPTGVTRVDVETACEMDAAVKAALPADIAVMAAAVADWRVDGASQLKLKKGSDGLPALRLIENPDILAGLSRAEMRPKFLIGFAAETHDVLEHARDKRVRKGADWIIANDVSGDVMGGDNNTVHIVSASGIDSLPTMTKTAAALEIMSRAADAHGKISQ